MSIDLATLQAVAAGTIGPRAAINRASKPSTRPARATTRSGRKTDRAIGRPATGRRDKLLRLLCERAALLVLAERTEDQESRLVELDLILTTPQRRARIQADPDEREVRLPDGRIGVRIKRQCLPRHVSHRYAVLRARAHAKPRESSPLGPTTPLYVDESEPDPAQWLYAGAAGAPDVKDHTYTPAKPYVTPGPIGQAYGVPTRPMATNSPLVDRSPAHPCARPTLPDQYGHSAPAIVALVKAGDMTPETAFGILSDWPENRAY